MESKKVRVRAPEGCSNVQHEQTIYFPDNNRIFECELDVARVFLTHPGFTLYEPEPQVKKQLSKEV